MITFNFQVEPEAQSVDGLPKILEPHLPPLGECHTEAYAL